MLCYAAVCQHSPTVLRRFETPAGKKQALSQAASLFSGLEDVPHSVLLATSVADYLIARFCLFAICIGQIAAVL
jgi:hypothetical protein